MVSSDSKPPSSLWPSIKLRVGFILLGTLFYPLVLYGALGAWSQAGTRVEDWLPKKFEEAQRLREFFERFGSDELLMIGWDDLRLGDDQLQVVREQLLGPDELDPQNRVFFAEVWTGDSVLTAMQGEPLELTARQAKSRMRGWMLGPDQQTAAIALVSIEGMLDRHAAVNFARRVTSSVTGLPADKIYLAGPTIESVAIDEASKSSLVLLNLGSFLACFLLLFFCIRRWFHSMVIFMIALYCQQVAMAIIYYSGGQMDSVLLLTANLAGVLSMSAAIHTLGYYRDASADAHIIGPVWTAFRRALLPTVLAAITTAIGFGSLVISDVVPVSNFGLYSAIAAPLAVMLTLWYLPMYLSNRNTQQFDQHVLSIERKPPIYLRWWPVTLTGAFLLLIVGGFGTVKLRTTVGLHDLFPTDAKLLRDYQRLEEHVGPLIPIEVVLEVPLDEAHGLLDELRYVATMQKHLQSVDAVGSTMSVLNYTPPLPRKRPTRSVGSIAEEKGYEAQLGQSLDEFEALRMLRRQDQTRAWRVTARVAGGIPQDFPELMRQIDQAAADAAKGMPPTVAISISGGVPLAAKTQQRLLSDLGESFLTALVLIGVTMAIVLRSPAAGIITLIPNVLPALVIFGTMGWLEWRAEIGGVMTASAVLGIAVDDSLHLIMSFRAAWARGLNQQQAALEALATCRAAIIQTSLVCGLGMLVFALSPFVPIQRFAWIMFVLLAVALLADLVLMPAFLYSPLGRFFGRSNSRGQIAETTTEAS